MRSGDFKEIENHSKNTNDGKFQSHRVRSGDFKKIDPIELKFRGGQLVAFQSHRVRSGDFKYLDRHGVVSKLCAWFQSHRVRSGDFKASNRC